MRSDVASPCSVLYCKYQEISIKLLLFTNNLLDMKRFGKRDRIEVFAGNSRSKKSRSNQEQHMLDKEAVSNLCNAEKVDGNSKKTNDEPEVSRENVIEKRVAEMNLVIQDDAVEPPNVEGSSDQKEDYDAEYIADNVPMSPESSDYNGLLTEIESTGGNSNGNTTILTNSWVT